MSRIDGTTKSLPLLIPFVGFTIAIVLMQSSGIQMWMRIGLPLLLVLVAIALFGLKSSLVLCAAMIFGVGAVLIDAEDDPQRLRSLLDRGVIAGDEPVSIIGSVSRTSEILPDGLRFEINVESIGTPRFCATSSGRLSVRVKSAEASTISSGSIVRVACFPRREEIFRNPGGFRHIEFLDGEDIDATCNLKSALLIEMSDLQPSSNGFDLGRFRNARISEIITAMGPVQGGVVAAVILGNKEFLDGRVAEIFRQGGIFHLLIISGLHMTFIAGVILFVVTLFTDSRWIHFALVTPMVWTYAELVGWERPITRACLMFTLFLLGRCFFRASESFNLVMATALISLAIQPRDIFTPSFQLTFLSVIAVTSFALPIIEGIRKMGEWTPSKANPFPPSPGLLRSIAETIYWNPRVWTIKSRGHNWTASIVKYPFANLYRFPWFAKIISRLFEGILLSFIVQIVLLPLQIILFHRITPAGILLNLVIAPLLAVQSLTALLMLAVGGLSADAAYIFQQISTMCGDLMFWISKSLLAFENDAWRIPVYNGIGRTGYLLHFVITLLILFALRFWNPFSDRPRLSISGTIVTILFFINAAFVVSVPLASPIPDGRLSFHFLDVGQGDSTFVIFPNGETMLIDAGGIPSFGGNGSDQDFTPDLMRIGESVVSEFLWEMGYSSIDHLVATHSDADHIQGLSDVIANFRVGSVHLGQMNRDSQEFKNLAAISTRRGVQLAHTFAGDVMDVGTVKIEVLNPPRGAAAKSSNEGSAVLRIIYGRNRFLLTGDIESEGESFLVSQKEIRADLVKVPHHGSRTSSSEDFINAVGARYAVIPVGRRSRFGHPHAEAVERWKKSGAKVMSTGVSGTITVTSDGDQMTITSFTGN